MLRRVPLAVTLVPLALLIAGYGWFWSAKMRDFRASTEGALAGFGVAPAFSGFPYRLRATLPPATLARIRPDHRATLAFGAATVDRQPWGRDLAVIGLSRPIVSLAAPGFLAATFGITAPGGRASLDTAFGRLTRLSAEFRDADLRTGLLPVGVTAPLLEAHLRETPVAPIALPTGPRLPTQAEAVLRAAAARLGGGDPLALEARFALTAPAPLRSATGWAAQGGTLEVGSLTLSDAVGEVLALSGIYVPQPGGRLRFAGAITTVCPLSALAALAGAAPPPREYRARTALRIAIGGPDGAVAAWLPGGLPPYTVRAQERPCPALRR